ncbi:type II toxin-antitoxin system PemK/MazF family toxin [Rhodopseudomonas palustris]|uniref:Type II toxin-antitoxin system PemK/MazF family toxin n=1 Tax=Rhodopseudomonas palustris TaxID=1076 RepID=A0A418V287_RHOPL|nr:type II toxin-antitoxin system PemK/MazF family toxin [Rhodopseudomonas palustris]RJF70171.1 type II toxin-antitoxin system PemK/MazF family toxin [Rhodopseudomonas palustris]
MSVVDVGDIAWVEFDPVLGTEQGKRRPSLILTPRSYHEKSGRAIVCPISSKLGTWPFNVALPDGMTTKGAVQIDQIRTIHRDSRMFRTIERAPDSLVEEVRQRLGTLLGILVAK